MKRVLVLITIAVTFMVSGCGSDPVRKPFTLPAVGSVVTRGVGERLLESATGVLVSDIEIQENVTIGEYLLRKGRYEYDEEDPIAVWYDGEDEDFYMRKADGQLCIEDTTICAPAKYTFKKRLDSLSEDTLQRTLLYNGKIGNVITLGYREFYSGMARPAFSNNAKYDLSESEIVGYKGARLEVINATNTKINYRVLSGFSG